MEGNTIHCPNCGKEILEGQDFCQECGTKILASMENDNPKKGNEETSNNLKKGKYKGLIALIVIVLIGVAGYFGYSSYSKQQMKDYVTEVNTYMTEINGTIQDLSFVNEAWDITESGSWLYYGTVKSYARSMFSSNITNAETAFESIEKHYKTIQELEIKNPDMQMLKDEVEEVHLSYEKVYSMIILFESGGNTAEINNLKKYISELKTMINSVKDEWGIIIDTDTEKKQNG